MTIEQATKEEVIGTSYRGHVKATYTELCQFFGQPTLGSDDGKVQARWAFKLAGIPVTIYDYREDIEPRNILLWHIGGKHDDVKQLVDIALKEQRKEAQRANVQ